MSPTDRVLLVRAERGDQAAFDRLVRRHTPRMYRVALRITGTSADAEDVVQDAWVSAWRSLSDFRSESQVSTWLYRVVSNAALMHVRRRRPTVSLDATLAGERSGGSAWDAVSRAEVSPDPEEAAVRSEQVTAVLQAVASLEPAQRVPFVLHELEGLSYGEVAEVLGVGVPALHSRLHRARVALLAKLKELR